ncbi:hypothetical protein VPNG_08358 [Cytospora leucostoma]|uniref:Uncharacterized protein n=1 Tax=Cytospora leucostoma TaxID=1230097 RepID=A0A423W9J2_9PEZI|nr:hypothetical protein VPNG_08358 [Cytospora leucostoma]
MIALLAPEIVLYMAASQFMEALSLKNKLKECGVRIAPTVAKDEEVGMVGEHNKYDLQWCFFIVMGGAKVHIRNFCPKVVTWNNRFPIRPHLPREATLTPKAVAEVIRSGHKIDIPSERIEDRSKQDAFQKILVAGQVSWMALQCVVRRCYGLPLTLLEVHTMVHVVCAISMYCFWLKKPQDVHEPEVVSPAGWTDLLALMAQSSFFHEENFSLYALPANTQRSNSSEIFDETWTDKWPKSDSYSGPRWIEPSEIGVTILRPGDALIPGLGYRGGKNVEVSEVDILRWTRAAREINQRSWRIEKPILLDSLLDDLKQTLTRGGNIDDNFRHFMNSMRCLVASTAYLKTKLKLITLCILY